MKKVLVLVGLAAIMAMPAAHADDAADFTATFMQPLINASIPSARDLINWKVGDEEDYNVTMAALPVPGSMVEKVTKDDGDGTLWFNETINMLIENQSVDIQIRKSDAKILQELVNGQPQQIDDTPPTVVSQDYESVTVPAGTFKAIHIVAKTTQQGQAVQLEEWANPKATCMDGSLKAIITTQGQTITEELKTFHKN